MFTCPRCGRSSHHPQDLEYGWCGACKEFTGEEATRLGLLPHLQVCELRVLQDALAMFKELTPRDHRTPMIFSLQTAVSEAMLNATPKEVHSGGD